MITHTRVSAFKKKTIAVQFTRRGSSPTRMLAQAVIGFGHQDVELTVQSLHVQACSFGRKSAHSLNQARPQIVSSRASFLILEVRVFRDAFWREESQLGASVLGSRGKTQAGRRLSELCVPSKSGQHLYAWKMGWMQRASPTFRVKYGNQNYTGEARANLGI